MTTQTGASDSVENGVGSLHEQPAKVAKVAAGSSPGLPFPPAVPLEDTACPPLYVKKLSANAILPVRGSSGAAGYDLASAHDATVPARGKALIKTDLAVAIPPGTYARIAPRSGLAWKHSIDVGAGVVDFDYRGNVGVILFNFSDADFPVKAGDRVAQLILERIATPEVQEVEELESTARGAGGYGSTGTASSAAAVAVAVAAAEVAVEAAIDSKKS